MRWEESGDQRCLETPRLSRLTASAPIWKCGTAQAFLKRMDCCFTRLQRLALRFTWKEHMNNKELYAKQPKVTDTVRQKRLKLTGHCYRHPEEAAHNLVLWIPNRTARTFVQQQWDDTGLKEHEMASLIFSRHQWRFITGRSLQSQPKK